jgi:hypothetical protein
VYESPALKMCSLRTKPIVPQCWHGVVADMSAPPTLMYPVNLPYGVRYPDYATANFERCEMADVVPTEVLFPAADKIHH